MMWGRWLCLILAATIGHGAVRRGLYGWIAMVEKRISYAARGGGDFAFILEEK